LLQTSLIKKGISLQNRWLNFAPIFTPANASHKPLRSSQQNHEKPGTIKNGQSRDTGIIGPSGLNVGF